jgi:hypothetical protein
LTLAPISTPFSRQGSVQYFLVFFEFGKEVIESVGSFDAVLDTVAGFDMLVQGSLIDTGNRSCIPHFAYRNLGSWNDKLVVYFVGTKRGLVEMRQEWRLQPIRSPLLNHYLSASFARVGFPGIRQYLPEY